MTDFELYLKLGFRHITDIKGYDHILFVVALCAIYTLKDWKKIALLVTAFTVGHSITLALATLNLLRINSKLVEFLIPLTIVITALTNVFLNGSSKKAQPDTTVSFRYMMALGFGLIHGLGFSNYLRSLLGNEQSLFQPLFSFNLGLELGQLLIVTLVLVLSSIVAHIFKVNHRDWRMVVSAIVAGMALVLLLNSDYFNEVILSK